MAIRNKPEVKNDPPVVFDRPAVLAEPGREDRQYWRRTIVTALLEGYFGTNHRGALRDENEMIDRALAMTDRVLDRLFVEE